MGVQAEAGGVPPSMSEPIQRLPGISGGVNQEIQTTLDSVTLLKLARDGTIPEYIAKVNQYFHLSKKNSVPIIIISKAKRFKTKPQHFSLTVNLNLKLITCGKHGKGDFSCVLHEVTIESVKTLFYFLLRF